MKIKHIGSIVLVLLSTTACWLPKIPGDEMAGDGDGDSEAEAETGEPLDLPAEGDGDGDEPPLDMGEETTGDGDGEPDPGWCCTCGTGDPLECTPSSASECPADGEHAWCNLDAEGNPSECETACEVVEPEGWCCDCGSPPLCTPADDCTEPNQVWCSNDNYPMECYDLCD